MDSRQLFPSEYLKAVDIEGKPATVTMKSLAVETVGDDQCPILSFNGTDKKLVLNKTNANSIEEMYGYDTEAWFGKQIVLVQEWTDYAGKRVKCIRINPVTPQGLPPQVADPVAGKPDGIPF